MNLASLLVHARPEQSAAVGAAIQSFPGVEVHATTEDGRLIVTVEETPEHSFTETVTEVHNAPGVLSATLVYHFCDLEMPAEEFCDETESA